MDSKKISLLIITGLAALVAAAGMIWPIDVANILKALFSAIGGLV